MQLTLYQYLIFNNRHGHRLVIRAALISTMISFKVLFLNCFTPERQT